jgi:AcrR family transcriptional regulator
MQHDAADRPRLRRVPQQSRSRDRVERILDTAASQVVAQGVEAVGTRSIAEAAGVPVASLYQYFADKDDILLALVERDIEAMDARVQADLAALPGYSIRTIVEATLAAFVAVYRERPAFVTIYLRGRTNAAIEEFCRAHNRDIARALFDLASDLGLLVEGAGPTPAEIAVEMGDRLFQLAFQSDMNGDPEVIGEASKVLTAYLELIASPAGIEGVRGPAA